MWKEEAKTGVKKISKGLFKKDGIIFGIFFPLIYESTPKIMTYFDYKKRNDIAHRIFYLDINREEIEFNKYRDDRSKFDKFENDVKIMIHLTIWFTIKFDICINECIINIDEENYSNNLDNFYSIYDS
ncbi:MAG: hypothetical protein ACTSRP_05100 [Candidatus Helarchaeota archaeon]